MNFQNQTQNETQEEVVFIKESDENRIKFSSTEFFRFIQSKGVRKVRYGSEYSLVHVKDYIVRRITPSEVKEIVLNAVKQYRNDHLTDYILNKTQLFSLKYLDAVNTIDLKMHRDKPGESFFYFRNGVVRVTADEISTPIPYKEFKRFIWEDHILSRDFNPDVDIDLTPPVFNDFILKLSNQDEQRFKRICSVLGYCLFDYKTSATSRAIIITDQEVSSNPEGGSGKSLLVEALSKIRKTVFYDGKTFDPKANFAWQKIDESVRLVSIDDAKRGFNFEDLFSIITAGFRNINKKNKDELELSIEESPTIIITTNNILKGNSGSFARRQYHVEIFQFFNKNRTPVDVYEVPFFSEWNAEEWERFDVFMLLCVKLFLRFGVTDCVEVDPRKKELIRATNQSFSEWMEDNLDMLTDAEGIGTIAARDEFLTATNQKHQGLTDRKFTDYIKSYCKIYEWEYIPMPQLRPRGFRIQPLN